MLACHTHHSWARFYACAVGYFCSKLSLTVHPIVGAQDITTPLTDGIIVSRQVLNDSTRSYCWTDVIVWGWCYSSLTRTARMDSTIHLDPYHCSWGQLLRSEKRNVSNKASRPASWPGLSANSELSWKHENHPGPFHGALQEEQKEACWNWNFGYRERYDGYCILGKNERSALLSIHFGWGEAAEAQERPKKESLEADMHRKLWNSIENKGVESPYAENRYAGAASYSSMTKPLWGYKENYSKFACNWNQRKELGLRLGLIYVTLNLKS